MPSVGDHSDLRLIFGTAARGAFHRYEIRRPTFPVRRSMIKPRLRPRVRQHLDDFRIVAERLVAAIGHPYQGLPAVCGRKIEAKVRRLFG